MSASLLLAYIFAAILAQLVVSIAVTQWRRGRITASGTPPALPITSGVWDANLLDFAERHALFVESGCRSGSCGTCEVMLISGTVRYAEMPDHEITPGHCLLCVGFPESALELEA